MIDKILYLLDKNADAIHVKCEDTKMG